MRISSLGNGEKALLLICFLFKKGDREDPGTYRDITLLSVVGKVFCKVQRLVHCLDKGVLHEGQAGFSVNRSCMDNVYTNYARQIEGG